MSFWFARGEWRADKPKDDVLGGELQWYIKDRLDAIEECQTPSAFCQDGWVTVAGVFH